ncbi:hypothetical protein HU200_025232 [Digitaria exilis]|uniref:Uncharacterized protein n=1 Tax=Digitaria exilis TaxID=1010633 RepID=A0A835C994_9POAL|nr:hypothetical protein HU200_025232 [Digitaria exilis]
MATAAQAAAAAAFLSFLSSSPTHHTASSSFVSLRATPVLPVSLRAAATGGPTAVLAPPGPSHRRRSRPAPHHVSRNVDTLASQRRILRWSSRAVRSFAMAELEARKMRYPTTGTEGLLMGILVEGEARDLSFFFWRH